MQPVGHLPSRFEITGVILAGGKARRMGGVDKGLVEIGGRPLVTRVADALAPQVGALLVNANRNRDAYRALGYAVVQDAMPDFQGPLAGLASAMAAVDTPWILAVPCDGPFLAPDLCRRLVQALADSPADAPAELAVASDGERLQRVHALMPVALAGDLRAFLAEGERSVRRWHARHRVAVADMRDCPGSFRNINTWEDIAANSQGTAEQGIHLGLRSPER